MFRPHIFVSAPNLLVFHLKFDFEADLAWFLDQIFSSFFSFFCWCFRGQNDPLQNAGVLSRVSFIKLRTCNLLPLFYLADTISPRFFYFFYWHCFLSGSGVFLGKRRFRFLRYVWLSFTFILPRWCLSLVWYCVSREPRFSMTVAYLDGRSQVLVAVGTIR